MSGFVANFTVSHGTFPGLTRDIALLRAAHRGPGTNPGKWWLLVGDCA
jgi:hypothetical protein